SGYSVLLADLEEPFLAKGRASIEKHLDREVTKGKRSPEDRSAALSRLTTTTELDRFRDADFVIEAVVEREPDKREPFRRLDAIGGPAALLASNTSSISITRLAAATRRPDRFIGMHFMNPVPVMELVEVIRGIATSDDTAGEVDRLARSLGKTPIFCNDSPG